MKEILLILGSYFLGSLNFAIIISKLVKKSDIRERDHAGASGVFRQYGMTLGIITLIMDLLKGAAVGVIATLLRVPPWALMLAGVAVVAGHDWPVFFGFSGGGGLAPLFGFLIVVLPIDTGIFALGTLLLAYIFWKTPLGKAVRVLGRPVPAAAIFGILAFFIFLNIKYGFIWYGLTILLLGLEIGLRRLAVLIGDKRREKLERSH
jgi:acyl-phosphate glycerol 3-phosphate acyltransferase